MRPRSRQIPRRLPPAALIVAGGLFAIALAGCDLMTAQTTSRPSRVDATPAPIVTAEPEPTDEVPTIRPDPSGIGPDIVEAANALADLRSYRVSVTSTGLVDAIPDGGRVTMTSTLVQTENPAAEFTMTGVAGYARGRLQAVVIGDEAWLREGTASWTKSPGGAADFDAAFTTLSPIDLATQFEALSAGLARVGTERRNGVATIHYRVAATDAAASAAGLTTGGADLWIAVSSGALVGLAVDGTWDVDDTPTSVVLRIEVSHLNDPANRITAPA